MITTFLQDNACMLRHEMACEPITTLYSVYAQTGEQASEPEPYVKPHATRVTLLSVESSGNCALRYALPSAWILDWSGPLPLGAPSP